MFNTLKSIKPRTLALVKRFRQEAKGVAAIEFAIIAPIMILLFFATVEVSTAVAVNRKISRVSSTLGDLITQSQKLSESDLLDIMKAATYVMQPYDHTLEITITGVKVSGGSAKVVWSRTQNASPYAVGANYPIPSKINKNGTFLVVAKVKTTHSPLFAFTKLDENRNLSFDTTAIDMEEEIFLRPRIGTSTSIE